MSQKMTDRIVKALPLPTTGNKVHYDSEVTGLGLRVTAAGARSFVFNYRIAGRERRYTIGPYGVDQWTLAAARKRAGELRRMVGQGIDPLADRVEARAAPTVRELCERFSDEHLSKKTRPATQRGYRLIIDNDILPALGSRKVADIGYTDIDALHRKITARGARYAANRTVAVLSKMFSLAIRWKMRPDNPAKGIERNQEVKRHRYLSADELRRLSEALADHADQLAADIIRLLLLTGARRGEVQAMKWADVDLSTGVWTKPGSTTKQKTIHRAPLSAPARQLLSDLRASAADDAEYVFPGRFPGGHRVEVKGDWAALCEAANIKAVRMHDLRHTYASILASAGASLPTIGALLGHSQPATTARYAHLFDDPLRAATETVGAIVTGKPSAEVVELKKGA